MTKRGVIMLEMIWADIAARFWDVLNFIRRKPTPIDFNVLDRVSAGSELRMVLRKDAARAALIELSLVGKILKLDERSREKLDAVLGDDSKRGISRYRSFTMRALPGFSKTKLLRRELLIAGLRKLEVTIEPPGRFGGNLRLVVSR